MVRVLLWDPVGCTEARLIVSLLPEMYRRGERFGCASLCADAGTAAAVIVEQCSRKYPVVRMIWTSESSTYCYKSPYSEGLIRLAGNQRSPRWLLYVNVAALRK